MEELGQSFRMITSPVKALTEKRKLFSEVYSEVFNEKIDARELVMATLAHRRFQELLKEVELLGDKKLVSEKRKAHLSIFPKARTQVISHGVACLFFLLEKAGYANGEKLWSLFDIFDSQADFEKNFGVFLKRYFARLSIFIRIRYRR